MTIDARFVILWDLEFVTWIISWEKHSVNQVIQVLLQFKHEN